MSRAGLPRRLALLVVAATVAVSCSLPSEEEGTEGAGVDDLLGDPGDCLVVDLAVSPEKLDLLTDLARTFNGSGAEVDGECVFVRPRAPRRVWGPANWSRAGTRPPPGPAR